MTACLLALAIAAAPIDSGAPPVRVATLAPSLTELVLALGEGSRLVAVSRYDDAPEVAKLPRLGGVMDPSPEAILAAKLDLLLAQPNPANREVLTRVAALGVHVLEVDVATLAQVRDAERTVGKALGVPEKGESLVRALEQHLKEVATKVKPLGRPRALVVYGWSPLVVAGPGSFADELLAAAGAQNAAEKAKAAYAPYSIEAAAASKPDVVIDASFDEVMPATINQLPGLATVRKVKPRSLALLRPGPRLGEALDDVAVICHPELEKK